MLTINVLARPGTPISRRGRGRAAREKVLHHGSSWPMITLPISSRRLPVVVGHVAATAETSPPEVLRVRAGWALSFGIPSSRSGSHQECMRFQAHMATGWLSRGGSSAGWGRELSLERFPSWRRSSRGLMIEANSQTLPHRSGQDSMDAENGRGPPRGHPVSIAIPVQWGDQDAFGHVNNTVYFRWFESARIAYFMRMGLVAFQSNDRIGSILASSSCDYRRLDHVSGYGPCGHQGHAHWPHQHRLRASDRQRVQGMLAAEGTSTAVIFDYEARRPHPVPEAVRRAIVVMEKTPFQA